MALRALLAAALGALHAASFAGPLAAWWVQLAALAALFALLERQTPSARFRIAAAFAFAWFAGGLAWLHTSMHVYGGMPWLLAATAVALFAGYLSLFPALAGAIASACRWSGGSGPVPGALSIAACWGGAEILRGYLLTGFPWLASGYAHVDGPLAGYAPWVGVYGVSSLAALVAALLAGAIASARSNVAAAATAEARAAELQRRERASIRRSAASALALAAAVLAVGALLARLEPTVPSGPPVTVRLVQGNVPQQLKFDPDRALGAMRDYARFIESGRAALVVLPETAWTLPWSATPPAIADSIVRAAERSGAAVAIGMPLHEAGPPRPNARRRYTNSVALIDPRAAAQSIAARYDKRHLVPFGEFIPSGFAWFVALMNIPLGEFGRGTSDQPPFEVAGQRFAFNICYEDLFGEELIGAIRGPRGATVLVNVSNIAWFGDSQALPQHLAISRMRTLETGRPMLRATNTGVTAAIDHRGRVTARLEHYTAGVLDVTVQGTQGLTAYARYGNALALVLVATMAALTRLGRARAGARAS